MRFGFSEEEYCRVRSWLIAAIDVNPGIIRESDLLTNLRSNEWHLLTSENAACVIQFCVCDSEKTANILLIGGEKNKSLREIMACAERLYEYLRTENFTRLTGTPRKEFHAFLKKNGFIEKQKELQKELN